jgi:hypothetical protein
MALSGQGYLNAVRERGIPEAWQEFGWLLSNQAALSTRLVAVAQELHGSGLPDASREIARLFDDLDKNLGRARTVIDEKLADYDAAGRWHRLDHAVRGADAEDVVGALAPYLTLHPLPIVVESLRFNFGFVLTHGYRPFYQMTGDYLAKLAALLTMGRRRLLAFDFTAGPFPPWALLTLDLNMIEVPMHCDVCRHVAAYGEYSLDQLQAR